MVIISEERKTPSTVNVTLWNDETPESLDITGADIGLADDIAVGSFMLTPGKRYIYGEEGEFVELEW